MTSATHGPDRDDRVPAAGAAIVQLLNSRPHAIHADRLDDAAHAAGILRQLTPGVGETPAMEEVRALRDDLVAIVLAQEPSIAERGWREFTARTSGVTLQQDFSAGGGVTMRQVSGDPVVGAIARAVAELVSSGQWSRVRFCANPGCEGAFFDTTRSRTQRWDSYETCGNRSNVAAYRARRAGVDTPSGAC
jgi:predicted RNA-binding Zn ribbon-like protein